MKNTKIEKRLRRKKHIRKNVNGTTQKPRIFVFKSNKYFYAGAADDEKGVVLMGMRSAGNAKDIKKMSGEFAKKLAKEYSEIAVFDRSGYKYHGLIELFVDELRNNKIKI